MTSHEAGSGRPRQWSSSQSKVVTTTGNDSGRDLGQRRQPTLEDSRALWKHIAGPSNKRQRIDSEVTESASTPNATRDGTSPVNVEPSQASSAPSPSLPRRTSPPASRPPKFPARPRDAIIQRSQPQSFVLAIERAAKKDPVQTRPYVPEPPTGAPRYQDGRCHPEDTLNESSTKNGFYDRPGSLQNEFLTARPSIVSTMKSRPGPRVLSNLFVSVLDQRQAHGVVSSTSTFKPPPRVTLTDAKREAWLRDLADPSIPLRRLSRTIPHGIRGKILLEHCLSKEIPTSRAIWLIKCVGANEIRAFKRKGTGSAFTVGGEAKWVQDWTTNVQQFLHGLILDCGGAEWKKRISYGLRLASHIYTDHLLDRGHYLNWLIENVERSDLDALPIWLLLLNIHKPDILRNRQHGRRTADALLGHLAESLKPAKERAYVTLQEELVREVRSLIKSSMDSFLSPKTWAEIGDTVRGRILDGDPGIEERLEGIAERNRAVTDSRTLQEHCSHRSAEREIIKALDTIGDQSDYTSVATSCLALSANHGSLVHTALRWAASLRRCGLFRVYATARLLRLWHEHGVQLQQNICDFLATCCNTRELDQAELYGLIAELIQSGHFSVGKYCQWLLARGTFNHTSTVTRPETRLLSELPLMDLPVHIQNLRQSLLRPMGFSVHDEQKLIRTHKASIAKTLSIVDPGLLNLNEEAMMTEEAELSACNTTVRYEIAQWLSAALRYGMNNPKLVEFAAARTHDGPLRRLRVDQFQSLRDIFEQLQVFPIFVDLLQECARSSDVSLLVAITDTANYFLDTLNALEASTALFDVLYERAQTLPALREIDKSFSQGLFDFARRLPDRKAEMQKIQKDLRALDQKQTVAAPSPLSDTMIDTVDLSNPNFVDEMEQTLTAGVSIDEATLPRAFETIVRRLQKSWDEDTSSCDRYSELLGRLRTFNQNIFDSLISRWIEYVASLDQRPLLSDLLPSLICREVVPLNNILLRLDTSIASSDSTKASRITLSIVELLTSMTDGYVPTVRYRCYKFLPQLRKSVHENLEIMLKAIVSCIRISLESQNPFCSEATRLLNSDGGRYLLRMTTSSICMNSVRPSEIPSRIRADLLEILKHQHARPSHLSETELISDLLSNVDEMSLVLYQLEISTISAPTKEEVEAQSEASADMTIQRVLRAPFSQIELWSNLVLEGPEGYVNATDLRAKSRIMSFIEQTAIADNQQTMSHLEKLFRLISTLAPGLPALTALSWIERLSTILTDLLSRWREQEIEGAEKDVQEEMAIYKLDLVLRLLIVDQSILQSSQFNQDDLTKVCLLLARLHDEFAQSAYPSISRLGLDLLTLLSDSLSESSRSRCYHAFDNSERVTSNAIAGYLFGTYDALDSRWLQLASDQGADVGADTAAGPGSSTSGYKMAVSPYDFRKWEMVQDVTSTVTENDASLSLTLFGARKSVL